LHVNGGFCVAPNACGLPPSQGGQTPGETENRQREQEP
jgi:hypothetical protein